jgi:hypothetical protein
LIFERIYYYIIPSSVLLHSPPSTQTTATGRPVKPRIVCTASQRKRSAAKAAETRARNKAAKIVQAGQPTSDERSTVNPPVSQIPQIQPGSTWSGNMGDDNSAYAYITLTESAYTNNIIHSIEVDPNLRTLQAPTTVQRVPSPPIEQGSLIPAPRIHSLGSSSHDQLRDPSFDPETDQGYRLGSGKQYMY